MSINQSEYLDRIGLNGVDLGNDLESLQLLQQQHLLTVPFENLDIHWKRPIVLDTNRFYEKIIGEGRGGFCYELNGLFNELLRSLGFQTRLASAKVFIGEPGYSPEFAHAAIIVTIGELEYLVDVGFGDFVSGPLNIVPELEQPDREGTFMILRAEDDSIEVTKQVEGEWVPQYVFGLHGRDLSEFAEMCEFQQYSSESHFTKGKVCSILNDAGRKTLSDTKFIVTNNGQKIENPVTSDEEFDRILLREFNLRRTV